MLFCSYTTYLHVVLIQLFDPLDGNITYVSIATIREILPNVH